ncbi:MAG: dolichyl-phosphate-mannose--protein mannosyltransferase, partial [candidate division Zixibacteria bacterium]|nr:dolichyl-phosphate-mannose--protein mannosyltransferase [candidate division Zixibacteria bacterium]
MTNSAKWSAILWVLLFVSVAARFYHFGIPILDHQSWRQADSAAMARNFYQEEFNPLYPRVDGRGWTSGHVESEFPLYSFLVAILYKMFGFHESVGR